MFIDSDMFKSIILLATWCLPQTARRNQILTSKQPF